VSLGKVESNLKIHSLVDNICVYGRSSENFTVAIVVPDEAKIRALATQFIGKTKVDFSGERLTCVGKNIGF
jgi:long-chain acyl-CoA synthetase